MRLQSLSWAHLALGAFVVATPATAFAQLTKAGVVTTLHGTATVSRAALAQPVPLKFKDDVFVQDRVATGDDSIARILLGGKAIITVRERSVVTLTELPGRSLINLESGKIGVAVARERMVPGESVDIRTPTASLGIRGTVIVAEIPTAQAGATNFFMLRGSGEVRRLDPATGAPVGPPVMLTAMQQVNVTGTTVRVAPIPPGQVAQVTAGLDSKRHPHSQPANQEQVRGQVTQATSAVLSVLSALSSGPGGQAATPAVSAAAAESVAATPEMSIPENVPVAPDVITDSVLKTANDISVINGDALIEGDSSTLAQARAIGSLLNQATLTLDGPFVTITDSVLRLTSEQVAAFSVINGASLITTSADPVFDFLGTTPGGSQITTPLGFFALGINPDVGPAIPASMTLTGGLLRAVNTDFTVGDPTTNAVSIVSVGDGSTLTSTSPDALLFFQGSNVDTAGNIVTLRRSLPGAPSWIQLAGPLFVGSASTFTTTSLGLGAQFGTAPGACCDGFLIGEGAQLTSSTTAPLLQLSNSSFNAGPDARSGGNFVNVTDQSADPTAVTAAAVVALNGPLLFMDSSNLSALFALLRVARSTFTSTGTDPLIQAVNATISLGGLDPISGLEQAGSVLELRSADTAGTIATDAGISLGGPFLRATNSTIAATNAVLNVTNGAHFSSDTPLPLIELVNTTLDLGSAALGSGRVLNIFGTGGPDGQTRATMVLNGALLVASGASTINALEGLVFASDGQILAASGGDSFVKLIGGTHALASVPGAAMFVLGGIATAPTADEVVDGVRLTLGTFAPLVWNSSGSLFRLEDGASVSGQKAFRIDTALFEATAPVFDLANGSRLTVAPTTNVDGGLMDLNARAKVVSFGPVARLDASTITISNNSAFRVAGGSFLKVIDDFLSLNNGSVLQALNGAVMRITGGSVVNISGAFAIFGGTSVANQNQIRVTNTLCGGPCQTFSGIPIAFTNHATPAQIIVTGNALKNTPFGSIVQSGVSAAAIVVDGTASRLTITGR